MQNLGKIVVLLLLTQFLALSEVIADETEFSLSLESTQNKVYVGEPFEVTLFFKEKNDVEAVDSEFFAPVFNNFWLKTQSKPQKVKEKIYSTTKIIYTIAAQRVGKLRIPKAEIRIAKSVEVRDKWGYLSPKKQWKTYSSNELDIEAVALPSGVDLVGEFSISAEVEKLEVSAGEALILSLEVRSSGNLEDIKSFKPSIDGVNIIDKEILIDGNKLTQKIVFIAENDFVITPFILNYFNPQTKKLQTALTKEISITLKDAKPKQELIIKSEEESKEEAVSGTIIQNTFSSFWMIAVYILGLASGVLLMFFKPWSFTPRKKSVSLQKPKTLLVKLFPYMSDADVQSIIDILEKKIYSDASVKIDKKALKNIIKKYDI